MSKLRTPSLSLPVAAAVIAGVVVLSAASGAGAARLITGAQIKNNTVTGVDIKNGSLTNLDIAAATLAALKGAQGPAGTPGAPGSPGSPGISGYQLVKSGETTVPDGGVGNARAICPAGKRIISGGPFVSVGDGIEVISSVPDAVDVNEQPLLPTTGNINAWYVRAHNSAPSSRTVVAYAICANIS